MASSLSTFRTQVAAWEKQRRHEQRLHSGGIHRALGHPAPGLALPSRALAMCVSFLSWSPHLCARTVTVPQDVPAGQWDMCRV